MKRLKKILALALAMAMVLGMMSISAFAAGNYTLTVNNTVSGHKYTAYQIFTGTKASNAADDDKLGDVAWGADITDAGKVALYKEYSITDKDGNEFTTESTDLNDGTKIQALVEAIAGATGSESDKAVKFANVFFTTTAAGDVTAKTGLLNTPGASQVKDATGTSVAFTGLDSGYYLVNDSYTAKEGEENGIDYSIARIAVQVVGNTTINNKADKPTLDKTIEVQRNGRTVDVDTSNGSIGDKVQYRFDSKVPNMEGYTSYLYEITDTMTKGLTFNDDISITIDKAGTNKTLTRVYKGTDGFFYASQETAAAMNEGSRVTEGFTVDATTDANGVTTIKVYVVNFIQYQNLAEKAIEVKYSATINQDALDTSASANNGQENKAKLKYSNKPEDSGKGENNEPKDTTPTGETPEDKVKTYTHGIEIIKVDAQDNTKKLSGAVFTIEGDAQNVTIANNEMYVAANDGTHWMLKDGTYTTTDPNGPNGDGKDASGANIDQSVYVSTTQKYKKITVVNKTYNDSATSTAIATSNDDGYIQFTGLGEGVYTITETKAPVGYNQLANPIYIAVKFTVAADGQSGTYTTYRYKGTGTTKPAMPEDPASDTTNWEPLNQDNTVKIESDLTIGNNSGTELPETGGIGTTIFYVVGTILVIGAGVVLITRRRMDA